MLLHRWIRGQSSSSLLLSALVLLLLLLLVCTLYLVLRLDNIQQKLDHYSLNIKWNGIREKLVNLGS